MLFSMCSVVGVSGAAPTGAVRRRRRLEGFALALPHDFPHHGTVDKYFHPGERLGIWEQIHDALRHQLREKLGRKRKSTVAIAQRIRAAAAQRWLEGFAFASVSRDNRKKRTATQRIRVASLAKQDDRALAPSEETSA